tara:strand:+ start:1393 stop:1566 length:174 start_codon:yes stop_codon:yes gene_type:complete
MKSVVFILVIMKGSEVIEEGEIGNYGKCTYYMKQINIAGTSSPYSAYCKPTFKKKEE